MEDSVIIPSTFNLLSSICSKQKAHKEALIWTAMEIINTKKDSRNKVFCKWIKIKAASKEDSSPEIQEFTIISVIKTIPKEYKCYVEHIQTREAQIELLISELEMYHAKWKSKVPMMSSFRHICQIGDKRTIMKIFVNVFTDEEIRVHAEVLNLVKNIFDELENSPKNRCDQTLMLYFSFYCFFLHKNQTIAMISKNLEEMEKVTKLTNKSDLIVDVTPSDAFDSCDIVSVYENLKVTGEKLKNLEKSLQILETIVASNPNPTLFKDVEPRKVYELVKNLTMEFVLHSDGYNSFRSLLLAFSVAEFINDKCLILECDGFLHRFLFFLKEGTNREEIICDLEKNAQSYKNLLQYYMNLSYFHVFHRNISLAYQYYKKAKFFWDSLKKENEKNLWSLEASMELLLYNLLDVAKAMNFEMEMKFSYGPLIKAYNMIVTRYTSESQWTTYSMIILMEIFNNLVKMYHDLKMPREVRYFGKQSLILAQQHVIPIHSAKMLCYLAYADLWSERLDDCRVKVDGISDILLLDKTQKGPKIIDQKRYLAVPSVDDIMEGINEIMLDTPAQSSYNASSPSSPVLQCQTYKCPLFMSHTLCDCFHCTSLECHKTVLSFYHLEALWYMHKGQITLAGSFFKGVFKLHESLSYKRKDTAEIFHNRLRKYSNLSQDFLKYDLENTISCDEIKIGASVSYIKFLVSSGAKEAAEKFCENALKKFTSAKIQFPHLYTEILLQKIGLICGRRENGKINLQPANDETDLKVKTPEACVKNILIPKINSPRKKKFLPPKVIKFTLTDSELSVTPSKAKDNSTFARTPKAKIIPPSLRNIETPKLNTRSRNNIFSEDNKKTTASEDNQDRTAKMDENQQSLLSEASSKHSATVLEDKTKLLTSRLRKKNVSENNSSDTSNVTGEKDVQPVRRSRRNRT
ncbi:uncharacterized protein LOC123315495 isoform X2 [Coccinella septempunctata]|nr:uncharacterized protein LOC123315495 isoform X2 [Coccinella septempunctata]